MRLKKHSLHSKNDYVSKKKNDLINDSKRISSRRKNITEWTEKNRLYDTLEVCEILGVSQPSVRRAIQSGKIKAIHVGRCLRIPVEEIERLVQGNEGLLNTREASVLLNVSTSTIRTLINSGKIQAFRLANTGPYKMLKSEVERVALCGIAK